MSGAGAILCGCCEVINYYTYTPCYGQEGPTYWTTLENAPATAIYVGELCYGWNGGIVGADDIEGMDELPLGGDECECPPEGPYYIFGPCGCDGGAEYWCVESELPDGAPMIGGKCYIQVRTETDPIELVGITHLAPSSCDCISNSADLYGDPPCGRHCIDCMDIIVGFEVFGPGSDYEIGYIRFSGADYPYYFDGDDCPNELADPPVWEVASGWRCVGSEIQQIAAFALRRTIAKGCPYTGTEDELSYDVDAFTWGGDPDCP